MNFWTATSLSLLISLAACAAPEKSFPVSEDTSPFPPPGLHLGHGAKTALHANFSCPDPSTNNNLSLLLLTGADESFVSDVLQQDGGTQNVYVAASQDEVDPSSVLVTVRIADSAARGIIPVGGQGNVVIPTNSCPSGEQIALNDTPIPLPKTKGFRSPLGLTPFPAEKQ